MRSDNAPRTVLIHEFTHAIDCIKDETHSVKVLYDNLYRYAGNDEKRQKQILECAATIIDDDEGNFIKSYLPSCRDFKIEQKLKDVSPPDPLSRPFQISGEDSAPSGKGRKKQTAAAAQKAAEENSGRLDCPIVSVEFLTFGMEQVFTALETGKDNPDSFRVEYSQILQKKIDRLAKKSDPDYVQHVLGPALELIKDTTSYHLDNIRDNTPDPKLKACCEKAKEVLEEKFQKSAMDKGFHPEKDKSAFLGGAFHPKVKGVATRMSQGEPEDKTQNIADRMRQSLQRSNSFTYGSTHSYTHRNTAQTATLQRSYSTKH